MSGMKVMVVDDARVSRVTTAQQLEQAGYVAEAVDNGFRALDKLDQGLWDVVVVDLRMPGMDGMTLLRRVRADHPSVDVVVMTAHGTVEDAVEAMHLGAVDFLTKPFSFRVLEARLCKLSELRSVRAELSRLREALDEVSTGVGLVGEAPSLEVVKQRIALFADHSTPVLVTGETGTGKELVARALHAASSRRSHRFVALGCGTIPREIAESELFGHERGAFTGAINKRPGVFERADRGTLLIDDIDDLEPALQVKLLRVLQEGSFMRVGGTKEIAVDVRVVATTKVDLDKAVSDGHFRNDLYYRLRALEVRLPPLRDRGSDVLLLAGHFLRELAERDGTEPTRIGDEAARLLQRYQWPGNVRELRGVMGGAHVLALRGEIRPEHLPEPLRERHSGTPRVFSLHLEQSVGVSLPQATANFQRALIDWAMQRAQGNQAQAAKLLGVPRTTLQSKLSAHG